MADPIALAASKHVSNKCPASKVAQRWLVGFQLTSVRWILLLQNYRCYSLSQVQTRWRLLIGPMLHPARVTNVHSRVYFFCRSRRRCRLPVPVAEAFCRLPNPGCRLPVAGCRLPVAGAGCELPVPIAGAGCRCRLPVAGCQLLVGLPAPVSLGRWPSLDAYTSLYAYTRICLYMPIRILLKEPQANHKVKLNTERK